MNPYISITHIDKIFFKGCSGCENHCCDGSRFKFSPLILDDFNEVHEKFPIVFAYLNNELRALMLLAKDDSTCKYYINSCCSIYESRPPACQIYPMSPYYEDVIVDTSCHGTGETGDLLATSNSINSSFYHDRFENFNTKFENTKEFLKIIEKDLIKFGTNSGIDIYKYVANCNENIYLKMHKESLNDFKV
ncbi:MAG: YkgJ family cysteine cluster protein [Campylobacterota bacterium]|nr:YkgJ family cysteine cluster protein [Campylobacterota bacterium]